MKNISTIIRGVSAPNTILEYQGGLVLRLARKLLDNRQVPDWVDEAFAVDVYYAFFVPIPVARPQPGVLRERVAVIQSLLDDARFWRVKPHTVVDRMASIVAAASFIDRLVRQLPRHGHSRGAGSGVRPESITDAVSRALEQAEQDVRVAKKIESIVYGSMAGNTSELAFENVLDAILRLARKTDISRVLDKLSGVKIPSSIIVKTERFTKGWIDGVEYGSDIERVHYTSLALPDEVFYALYAESKLLLYRKVMTLHDGPVYVLLDKSGSMVGEKIDWARAVAVALFQRSVKSSRPFYVRFFDATPHSLLRVGIKPKPKDVVAILEYLANVRAGGGTDITRALVAATEDIEKARVARNTDIVIITDGEDKLSYHVLSSILSNTNNRVHTIMIKGHNETLREISTTYMRVEELGDKDLLRVVEMVESQGGMTP